MLKTSLGNEEHDERGKPAFAQSYRNRFFFSRHVIFESQDDDSIISQAKCEVLFDYFQKGRKSACINV